MKPLKPVLRRFRVYRALSFAWQFATDRGFRHDHIQRFRRRSGQFQYRSTTAMNRYPRIFAFLKTQLAAVPAPRLLSFGCATGEEVFSLRRYFSAAVIKGVDINPHDIAACDARLRQEPDANISFARDNSANAETPASYDAVLCMAVFQHPALRDPAIRSCEALIRFEAFEDTLAGLARCLKPGGYLAMRHANFRFADAACSADFECVLRISPSGDLHPRFDRDNHRLPDGRDDDVVFRKRRPTQ